MALALGSVLSAGAIVWLVQRPDGGGTRPPEAAAVRDGGTLVVSAQEPDCADWIDGCGASPWARWTLAVPTVPRPFDFDPIRGELRPSALLAGEPTAVDDGRGLVVTYRIEHDARWSDGRPITSSDFAFTWRELRAAPTDDLYDLVTAVDASDASVAVVRMSSGVGRWRDLFGGSAGILPAHLLQGVDRRAAMRDGYRWSGGPWMLDKWEKGKEIDLVPNPRYWGPRPHLDRVVFRFSASAEEAITTFEAGGSLVIRPTDAAQLSRVASRPDAHVLAGDSLQYEAIWFNTAEPPLDELGVRRALAFATDRKAIVRAIAPFDRNAAQPLQAFASPSNAAWYEEAFESYQPDSERVAIEMQDAGWAKDQRGVWSKSGEQAVVKLDYLAGDPRRQRVGEILESQWEDAGFAVTRRAVDALAFARNVAPAGEFGAAVYAQVPDSVDPGLCEVFCAVHVPSKRAPAGRNWTRLESSDLDTALRAVDETIEPAARHRAVAAVQELLARELPALPLDSPPELLVFRGDVLRGPIRNNPVLGPFWNLADWSCTDGRCDGSTG